MNKLSDRDKRAIAAGFGITAGIITGSAMVDALPAKSVEIGVGDQSGIYDYLNAGQTGLVNLDFELDEDEDGNRSTRVKIYALQSLAFSEQSAIYDQMDFSAAPDTVTVSGSGTGGIYKSYKDQLNHTIVLSSNPSLSNIGFSDEFTLGFAFNQNPISFSYNPPIVENNAYRYWFSANFATSPVTIYYPESVPSYFTGSFQTYNFSYLSGSGYTLAIAGNSTPYLHAGYFSGRLGSGGSIQVGAYPQDITLPPGTIDTENPWDYYNNILLPYMEEEFPGYDEYFVFPDGYTAPEPPPQVPTEYPTLPGWDFTPVADGTLPAGAESVAYEMPEIPTKTVPVPAFDLTKINPAEVLSPFAEGFRGIWDLIADVLVSFDLLPVVSLCFLVLIVCAFIALGVK